MLDDTSRKVLRILFNLYRFEEFKPDIELIARYSMRSERRVKEAINLLVKDGYVKWFKDKNEFIISYQDI